jgi:hypothetical protein
VPLIKRCSPNVEDDEMRAKRRSGSLRPGMLLRLASHSAMGIALGVAFAFVVTSVPTVGVMTLIDHSIAPRGAMLAFVGAFATMFGIGATLTGLLFIAVDDS